MGFFDSAPKPAAAASRPFRFVLIIGSPGMGKSALAEELQIAWTKERKGRGVIAVLDPARQFRHLGDAVASWPGEKDPDDDRSPEQRAEAWLKAFKRTRVGRDDSPPALVILDDADTYMGAGSPRGVWRDFLMTFRHWRADVMMLGRRTQELPKVAVSNCSSVAIFFSSEPYYKEYIRAWLGSAVVKAIPLVPHQYILVDTSTKEFTLHTTKKRANLTAADLS